MTAGSPAHEEEIREAQRHDRLYRDQRPADLKLQPGDWERFDGLREPLNAYAASVVALGDLHGRKVLDMGCGDGWFSVILAKRGATVWGFDISSSAIDTARARAEQNGVSDRTHFDVASAYQLPYPDTFFDVVAGQAILHHLGDRGRLAREIRRVMRPGAKAVFSEPFAGVQWLRRMRKLVPVPSMAPDDPDQDQFTYAHVDDFRECFDVAVEEYQLLARLERVLSSSRAIGFLKRTDRMLLRRAPFLRKYARSVVVTLTPRQS